MALIGTGQTRLVVRRELAKALRFVADRLREEQVVLRGTASSDAGPGDDEAASARFGAAAYVDAHQRPDEPQVEQGLSADDLALMGVVSGDLGPALAERVHHEPAEVAGGDEDLQAAILEVLHTIYDPEIPVDIYDLGLIYAVDVDEASDVSVRMTLTSPNCPAAQSLPGEVETKIRGLDGVRDVVVDVVFDPPWTPDLMSEEAKLELNIA